MKSVVLSTTEAEYMALSEVVKELKFIVQLLQTMNITVELPITVHVDNVGAIWLSNNRNTDIIHPGYPKFEMTRGNNIPIRRTYQSHCLCATL